MPIRYREIPGYPGYFVGHNGTVWSTRMNRWSQLSTYRRPYGAKYMVVCLRAERNGVVSCKYVHRLVLEAFVGRCPQGMEALHRDCNTANNHLSNLRWGTVEENVQDSQALGRLASKLTADDVREIRRLCCHGLEYQDVAEKFGIHKSTVGKIFRRRSWSHIV